MRVSIHVGDALDVLRGLESCSVDALVTDPPAGISFMGRDWDHHRGGRDGWVSWLAEVLREALRVCKPGAHAFVWALPRTAHWTACAVEDAVWEIRDRVTHIFGSGFPKSHDVSKAIDREAGAERRDVGRSPHWREAKRNRESAGLIEVRGENAGRLTLPTTPEAAQWDGWGTALKPATEYWILARKPLNGTIASNVLEWGTGALNIEGCRVAGAVPQVTQGVDYGVFGLRSKATLSAPHPAGRWPPNLLLSHAPGCVRVGTKRVRAEGGLATGGSRPGGCVSTGSDRGSTKPNGPNHYDSAGLETIDDWRCVDGCPVAMLRRESEARGVHYAGHARTGSTSAAWSAECVWQGVASKPLSTMHRFGDTGTAARFFPQFHYAPKVRSSERWGYCLTCGEVVTPERRHAHPRPGHEVKYHPTQKSVELIRWLTRLILPPGGVVLDPFCGSGTHGVAAGREGASAFIGIDADPEFALIADRRIKEQAAQGRLGLEVADGP